MHRTAASEPPSTCTSDEIERLRGENARLRETLADVLVILGNPAGYCEHDRREVAEAVLEIQRALGSARESVGPSAAASAVAR